MNRKFAAMLSKPLGLGLLGLVLLCSANAPQAKPATDFKLTIAQNRFEPSVLNIPAGQRIKIDVENATVLPAEFESSDFTVEKVIPGHTSLPVYVGPLKAGRYRFFNDFAQNVTGHLVVKQ